MPNYHPFHTSVFLPKYFFELIFHEGDINSKPDPQLFISEAATSQILEIIRLFYPHIRFSVEAEDNDSFLQKVFLKMVAPHLSSLIIPKALKPDQHYLQAWIDVPAVGSQELEISILPGTVIDSSRILQFNYLVLSYLKNGQHRLAADNLTEFVKTHKYLNDSEISTIDSAYEDALEGLHESVRAIQNSYQEIEGIGLQSCDFNITQSHRQDLQLSLQGATTKLQSRQKTFDSIVQGVGFLQALSQYHKKLTSKNRASPPESS